MQGFLGTANWPPLVSLYRVLLALGISMFVGLEREWRGKEAGLRTFGFAALLGALGGLLGEAYAIVSICLLGILVFILNWQSLKTHNNTVLTTSIALLVTGVIGVLCGVGHTVTPAAVGVIAAGLLAWKERLAVFSHNLTAEEVRDSILAVSGNLNLKTHGEWVYPPLPPEVLATASRPGAGWPVSEKTEDHFRRSLYVHVKRSLRHEMLADFDQAATDTSCAVRFTTTVPTQALAMLNSAFVNRQGESFAARMREQDDDLRGRIAAGLTLALHRPAKSAELDHLVRFYDTLRSEAGLTPDRALDRVALLILNLNEFIYLD